MPGAFLLCSSQALSGPIRAFHVLPYILSLPRAIGSCMSFYVFTEEINSEAISRPSERLFTWLVSLYRVTPKNAVTGLVWPYKGIVSRGCSISCLALHPVVVTYGLPQKYAYGQSA